MSAIWADFPSGQKGLYGSVTADMLNGIWAELNNNFATTTIALTADPDPNIGSAGYVLSTKGGVSGDCFARIIHPTGAQATSGMAFRLWMTRVPQGNGNNGNAKWGFRTSANAVICYCQVMADGSIGAYNSSNTLLGQSAPCVTANAFSHIETKVLRHASAGTIEVRVNGVAKLTLTDLALGASDIGQVIIGSKFRLAGDDPTNYYKDFVYWDANGSVNNDFLGSVSVYDQIPDGDISFHWTASSGSTGYNLIDEGDSGPDDTDYISADSSPPSASIFSTADLPADVTSVKALFPIARMEKTDGGDCTVQMSISPNGTDWDDGAANPITTAFTYWWDVSEVSPATAAAWTPTEANAAELKINRTL